MSIRQIQIIAPLAKAEEIRILLEEEPTNTFSMIEGGGEDKKCHFLVITRTGNVQNLLDRLRRLLVVDGKEIALVTILQAEGSLPYPETERELSSQTSQDELYANISSRANASGNFFLLIFLSTIIAFIGFMQDSPALLIAAMVLAPLLGPNIAAGFASLIGAEGLWRRAMRASMMGIGFAFIISCVLGVVFPLDIAFREVASRTVFSWSILVLALVSGVAGALTFTTALSDVLVGVMVGIALLPPIVVLGSTLVMGEWHGAIGAFLIFIANLAGLNLAATATFRLQGIRPKYWYQKQSARRVTWISLIIWTTLLSLVIFIQFFTQ
jgi:uncharacterized hydrophobic protein (TIGR00341 family)